MSVSDVAANPDCLVANLDYPALHKDWRAFNELNRYLLNKPKHASSFEGYLQFLAQPNKYCIVARMGGRKGKIIAKQTMYLYFLDHGVINACIHNVVTHPRHRGKGLGRRLTLRLIEIAREKGVSVIELTSNPTRISARSLYENLGFEKVSTDTTELFRLRLS